MLAHRGQKADYAPVGTIMSLFGLHILTNFNGEKYLLGITPEGVKVRQDFTKLHHLIMIHTTYQPILIV